MKAVPAVSRVRGNIFILQNFNLKWKCNVVKKDRRKDTTNK